MRFPYDDTEEKCLNKLAELFNTGDCFVRDGLADILCMDVGITRERLTPILATFEQHGIISEVAHLNTGVFGMFKITPIAMQTVRDIANYRKEMQSLEEQEKRRQE